MLIFNGELIHPSEVGLNELERGLYHGDGCFETLRLHRGTFPLLRHHAERLKETAAALGLHFPEKLHSPETPERWAALLRPAATGDFAFRLTLWRAGNRGRRPASGGSHWMLQCLGSAPDFFQKVQVGVKPLILPQAQGPFKLLGQNAYTRLPFSGDAQEFLLADQDGRLVESLHGNVWVVREDALLTPPLSSGCINGVWRRAVLSVRQKLSFRVEESDIRMDQITEATPLMLGNALRGFYPVHAYHFPQTWAEEVHQIIWTAQP